MRHAAMCFFGILRIFFIIGFKRFLNLIINRAFGVIAALVGMPGFSAGQNFYAVVNRIDCINMELSVFDSLNDIFAQHQVFYISARHNNPLVAGQPAVFADIEKAFDFFINAADRLNFAKLVN